MLPGTSLTLPSELHSEFFFAGPPRLGIPDQATGLHCPRKQQRMPVSLQRHIERHLQRRKAQYRRRHPLGVNRHQWNLLHLEESNASESLLPTDRQMRTPPNKRVLSGSLHLLALSRVRSHHVKDFSTQATTVLH